MKKKICTILKYLSVTMSLMLVIKDIIDLANDEVVKNVSIH